MYSMLFVWVFYPIFPSNMITIKKKKNVDPIDETSRGPTNLDDLIFFVWKKTPPLQRHRLFFVFPFVFVSQHKHSLNSRPIFFHSYPLSTRPTTIASPALITRFSLNGRTRWAPSLRIPDRLCTLWKENKTI